MKTINKLIILVIVISMGIGYRNQFNSIVENYQMEIDFRGLWIGKHIDLGSGFFEFMKIYGSNYIKNAEGNNEYFELLQYADDKQGYHLDAVERVVVENGMGNLTGLGPIPGDINSIREINLGLELSAFFKKVKELIPDVAWLYYTSDSGFVSMYPFISSDDFFYKDELKETTYFTYANPINNPERASVWTPVYLDQAGKGLMVTYSCPLYVEDDFKGILSLDFTNQFFSDIMYSEYEGYVTDQTGALIATSKSLGFTDNLIYINEVMDFTKDEWKQIDNIDSGSMQIISGDYIYKSEFASSPWTMYFRLPIWQVAMRALLLTLPMIVIGSLFLYTLSEIERRRRIQRILSDTIKERKEYQDLLENAAKYDFLTSTLNRRGMEEQLYYIHNLEEGKYFYIIMADLDLFKNLNDTYSHQAGDRMLIAVAEVFKKIVGSKGYVSRWGGEEFLLVLDEVEQSEIDDFAEHIRRSVEELSVLWKDDQIMRITVTMGIAEYNSELSVEKCISYADQALYQGKSNGRNQVVRYREMMQNQEEL